MAVRLLKQTILKMKMMQISVIEPPRSRKRLNEDTLMIPGGARK